MTPKLTHVEVIVRCTCDCACHATIPSAQASRCGDRIEEGARDCAHDCRGTESGIVCDPFIESYEEAKR